MAQTFQVSASNKPPQAVPSSSSLILRLPLSRSRCRNATRKQHRLQRKCTMLPWELTNPAMATSMMQQGQMVGSYPQNRLHPPQQNYAPPQQMHLPQHPGHSMQQQHPPQANMQAPHYHQQPQCGQQHPGQHQRWLYMM
mmetsp:Transcript_17718/g.31755  ORF Transcript_17718/g.31755 Transcript_17718/m.31755 type:complete len:139 (-) Transcript_17718:152-568(-)